MAEKCQEENSNAFTATGPVPAWLQKAAKSLESLDERHRGFRIRPGSQEMQCKSEGRMTAQSRQSKAGRSQLEWVSNKPSRDRRASGLISHFRSSELKECVPGWTKNTIKGGSAVLVDKNINLAVEAKQASGTAYQQEAQHSLKHRLALEAGHRRAKGSWCLPEPGEREL